MLCKRKLDGYEWKWKAKLIQYNLTSGVIYAQPENVNNASCVFFHIITWVTSVLLSMNWSEIIPKGMIKRDLNLNLTFSNWHFGLGLFDP